MKQIGIYGAGGFAREVAWLASTFEAMKIIDVVAYIDDAKNCPMLYGKPVLSWQEFSTSFPDALVSIAIGSPQNRERIASMVSAAGFSFATLEHHSAEHSQSVSLGEGSIICANSILTVDIGIGKHVQINLGCTIGHDVRIGDFSTLAPGVHISGNVHIGKCVYIGTGATVINGTPDKPLTIGDGAVVAAGACVTKDCEPRCMYAGVPAILKRKIDII